MAFTDDKIQHSSYYHRRYQGFMETPVIGSDGKKHIERVYTGDVYLAELPAGRRTAIRAGYAALYLLSAGLFLYASSGGTAFNRALYVQFASFLALSAQFITLWYLIAYLAAPGRMTVWQHYAGPVRLKRWSGITALLLAAETLAAVLFILLHPDSGLLRELGGAACLFAAAAAMAWIYRIESRIPYIKIPCDADIPRGGYYIDD